MDASVSERERPGVVVEDVLRARVHAFETPLAHLPRSAVSNVCKTAGAVETPYTSKGAARAR